MSDSCSRRFGMLLANAGPLPRGDAETKATIHGLVPKLMAL
jgi:hypothetical protein